MALGHQSKVRGRSAWRREARAATLSEHAAVLRSAKFGVVTGDRRDFQSPSDVPGEAYRGNRQKLATHALVANLGLARMVAAAAGQA